MHNQVYRGLWAAGRYAFPGGTTGIVGFGGLALGEPDGLAPLSCLLKGKTASANVRWRPRPLSQVHAAWKGQSGRIQ